MKILYCNKYNFRFSGTEAYLFDLMQLVRERGHQTALFSMADPRGEPTAYDQHFVPHVDFKRRERRFWQTLRLAAHAVYSVTARMKIGKVIEQFHPDVAHVRNVYHHLSPSIFWELKKRRVPVLYHLNDFKMLCPNYNMVSGAHSCERCRGGRFWHVMSENCYAGGRAASAVLAGEAYFHRWLRTYERCVDRFLVPSEFVQRKLVEHGWDESKIVVLPHFQRVPNDPAELPHADAPILYFGRLSAEKGVDDLVRAIAVLPDIRLNIAGDGPERANLERLVASLRLRNITFLGHVNGARLDHLIMQSRFTVLPSRAYETLGKTILESYAHARAVVASDLGSRREFIKEGETGLLYRVGDIAELAKHISRLWEHPKLAEKMGLAGFQLLRQNHAPADHYQKLTALYEEMASGRAAKSISGRPFKVAREERKLRVAFIGARGVIGKYSGIEGYYEEVGSRLARAGHDVTVYCRSYFTPPCENHNGMRLVRLPTIRSKHLETAVHTILSSLHVLSQPCDIVHYHALGPSLFSLLPRIVGKKTVVTVQGLDWQRKKWGWIASRILRLGEASAIHLPNRTMVVSQTLQSYYKQRYGKQTIHIPNGAALREKRCANEIRAWGFNPDEYVLFLGRFSPEKNCDLLIEAFGRLNTKVDLVLAGGGDPSSVYAQGLRRQAGRNVHFLDYASGDVFEELLTNAMLLVLPSDLEGLSLALLEAMGAGVCVLASDIPENREVVEGAGFLFRAGDVDDLESKLRRLIPDASARESAGRRAKQRIRDKYQWDEVTRQIEQVYLEVVAPNAALTACQISQNRARLPDRMPVTPETKGDASSNRRAG